MDEALCSPAFNQLHIAAGLTRLAQLEQGGPQKLRKSPVLARWIEATAEALGKGCTEASVVAMTFWSVAALSGRIHDLQRLVPPLLELIKFCSRDFNARYVALIVWGCAHLKLPRSQLQEVLPVLTQTAVDKADAFDAQGISNMIWSGAKLRHDAPELLEIMPVMQEMVVDQAGDMIPQHVANIIWATSILWQDAPSLLDALPVLVKEAKTERLARGFSPQMLANMCWGLAACGFADKDLMSQVAVEVVRIAPGLSDKSASTDITQIAGAFAKLGMRHRKMMRATAERSAPVLRHMNHWNLCVLAWSYDQLDDEGRFSGFRQQVWDEIKRRHFSLADVESSQLGPDTWRKKR